MKKTGVAITGLGVLSPIGLDVAEVAAALQTGRSGIAMHPAPPIIKPFAAGVIDASFDAEFSNLERPFLDRCQQLAILAARQAAANAGVEDFSDLGERAGLYYGNVNGGAAAVVDWSHRLLVELKQAARPFTAMAIMGNAGAAQIGIRHKILGPVITNASACGSSGVAIGEAARAIADGYLDIAIAGGAEAPLTPGVLGVFQGTRAMASPDESDIAHTCKPFSRHRKGLVLGEGAAFMVLESEAHARARGARMYGHVVGYGIANDAHHIGMPSPEGQIRCLRTALADADAPPSAIQYLNAHATATNGGDVIEAGAIRAVFGDSSQSAYVSSTKSVHGHLIGATSALELLITVLAINESVLPAGLDPDDVDDRCHLNHVGAQPMQDHPVDTALSFSCGFGGTNVALIVSRHPK